MYLSLLDSYCGSCSDSESGKTVPVSFSKEVFVCMSWVMAAVASAFFAGITSILAKCGLSETDSDIATALRTLVVLVFAWIMVAVVGSGGTIAQITPRSWLFLALSGLATGGSWICYFKALSLGDVNKVVPVDKSSTVMAWLLANSCYSAKRATWE